MNIIQFKKFKAELLKDTEIKKEYDLLDPEFALIGAIVEKRIQMGMTQKDLAEQAHTTQSAISRLESGRYNPSLSLLVKISVALHSKLIVSLR